jgi:diguanylate cyclase (GGDEF)-like protein
MKRVANALRALPPQGMLRIYLVIVVATTVVALGVALYMISRVDEQSGLATNQAHIAVAASDAQADLRDPVAVLYVAAFAFLQQQGIQELTPEMRSALVQNVLTGSESLGFGASFIPDIPVEMGAQDAVRLQRAVDVASARIDALQIASHGDPVLSPVTEERDRLEAALAGFLETHTAPGFRDTFVSLIQLGARLRETSDVYEASLAETQSRLASATNLARYTVLAALISLSVTIVIATALVSRLIQRAFQSSEIERNQLRTTSETLQYRNEQLNALYNVFAEITDTLSMRHVINATLRETLRVMQGSSVVLRLLNGSQLVVAGSLTASGGAVTYLTPLPIGEGPAGRVARRGRSMRIEKNAREVIGVSLSPDDPATALESGVIVPLVVGARIVGTLACWSDQPYAYQEQDERVLEMMASQVATAVLAAETQESLERHALSDPLTNLPNRRQLSQDMNEFADWHAAGRSAVIAMVDLDNFKQVNDRFGHKVGDETLLTVATVMRDAIRESDRIYRYGGEEFVLIFPDATGDDALQLTVPVLDAVRSARIADEAAGPVGPITVSAGLALMPEHGEDVPDLIVLADRAMYQAKQAGRNRVVVWDADAPRTLDSVA